MKDLIRDVVDCIAFTCIVVVVGLACIAASGYHWE